MKPKSKAILLGGVLGTILLGPGYGTLLGAAWGGQKHDEEARKPQDRPDDDDEEYDYRNAQ